MLASQSTQREPNGDDDGDGDADSETEQTITNKKLHHPKCDGDWL